MNTKKYHPEGSDKMKTKKKILLEILKELKEQNKKLEKLSDCANKGKIGEAPYITIKKAKYI